MQQELEGVVGGDGIDLRYVTQELIDLLKRKNW